MANHEDAIWNVIKDKTAEEISDTSETPSQPPDPVPGAAKIMAIVERLKHPERHNGFLGIARAEGVSPAIVRMVESAVQRRLLELAPAEEPIEEPIGK